MSPRPRSRDKVVPVSIGIPVSLMMRLDNELDWKQSRSKWVKAAIIQKLDHQFDVSQIPTSQLVGMLHYRGIISTDLLRSIMMQVEETVEEQ